MSNKSWQDNPKALFMHRIKYLRTHGVATFKAPYGEICISRPVSGRQFMRYEIALNGIVRYHMSDYEAVLFASELIANGVDLDTIALITNRQFKGRYMRKVKESAA
jgi:hypothetical protein